MDNRIASDQIVPERETLTVAFQQDFEDKASDGALIETVVGMANAEGGTLYIGVGEEGRIFGVRTEAGNNPEKAVAFIASHTVPPLIVSAESEEVEGKKIWVVRVPKAEGTYPALLRVPGAGVRPYSGDTYTAPGKLIVLEVGIHGIPVTMQQSVYDNLANGSLNNYWTFRRDDRDAFYYNRVIVGALRAVDFICSLPQYNGKALGVTGSSQGGALSVITAALDSRVTCLAAVHPALCDHEAWFEKRACGWPHYYFYYGAPTDKERQTARYYDTANFARQLKVPGWFSWGYNDEVCPPTSMYAAYNAITAPKELHPYLETGHYWYQEQWDAWLEWLRGQLGVK